jgi:hypothetical protein
MSSLAIAGALDTPVAQCEAEIATISAPCASEPSAGPQIAAMRRHGLLAACVPVDEGGRGLAHHPDRPDDLLDALIAMGRANLSAGRLFEGHVNALKLVALHARGTARRRLLDAAL